MNNILKNKNLLFGLILILLIVIRIPGLHISYYQDEYKWPILMNPELTVPGSIPHPPLSEFIYSHTAKIFGYENFRYTPFLFSIFNLFLLFYLVKKIFNDRSALISSFLYAISGFSVIASLMVDTDGQILPFFFLLSVIFYINWRESVLFKYKILWFAAFLLSIILGFLVKLSFIIAIGTIVFDFFYSQSRSIEKRRRLFKYIFFGVGGLSIFLVIVLIGSRFIFPYFNLTKSFSYWIHFIVFSNRNYLQIFIQFFKALIYISPLLLLPIFWMSREIAEKLRIFWLFIVGGLIFYLVLFDFSTGALDRYFQFLILPLCIISGVVISDIFYQNKEPVNKKNVFIVLILSMLFFAFQFLPHFVPPLYPKEEWMGRVFSLRWNFLFPFFGGSGPLGFYVSWLFISLNWLLSFIFMGLSLFNKKLIKSCVISLLVVGIFYNGVFIEEYLFGKINGSTSELIRNSVEFIRNNPDIKKVMVYNDNGGNEIRQLGKYERRIYAVPGFENSYESIFKNFVGNVLYIDIPKAMPNSLYDKFFNSCQIIYFKKDKYIDVKVLSCKN